MIALLLLSIALLLAVLAGYAVLWHRSGETRVGLFGALFLLIAIHQGATAWTNWSQPLGWNGASLERLLGLAVAALGAFSVVALWRTLAERDRAERLHWDSMETVRIIDELNENDSMPLDVKIAKLLEMGAARFGLEVAMVARVREGRYEVIAIHAPEDFPIVSGAVFPLEETVCKNIVDSDRPVGIEQIEESDAVGSRERATFGFAAYLGAAIRIDGAAYGTLSFASFEPRADRFSGTEKDLIRLMAQCVGSEIARSGAAKASAEDAALESRGRTAAVADRVRSDEPETSTRSETASIPGNRSDQYTERAIDPNRILQRIGNELRMLAGDAVHLEMKLDPNLGFAAARNVPLKAIARTLVMNAREAMPEGGELVIESANLEVAGGESGQMPAVAPDRYVTISFRDSGAAPDADALARLFDRAPSDSEQPSGQRRLPLSTVYRVLQICGGDLSVKVEPGRGTTFTVFLPRAREQLRAPRKAAPALAPAPPSPTSH
ncbi:MAG: GAF domain-containing protein [Deltaproteobacteria bacterium]|jgi:GAF domain-containing protein|nr:GAF domain-containing protein [Deltaproteobacteria bacterium]